MNRQKMNKLFDLILEAYPDISPELAEQFAAQICYACEKEIYKEVEV